MQGRIECGGIGGRINSCFRARYAFKSVIARTWRYWPRQPAPWFIPNFRRDAPGLAWPRIARLLLPLRRTDEFSVAARVASAFDCPRGALSSSLVKGELRRTRNAALSQ